LQEIRRSGDVEGSFCHHVEFKGALMSDGRDRPIGKVPCGAVDGLMPAEGGRLKPWVPFFVATVEAGPCFALAEEAA